ncbi:amidase [Alkalicoccus chagannorensis]|uniref:amidase n=1 Tax=Alkalicoccus chagannorensis TaxID=427072 RepID=UPI00047933AD|nr:amidase [Alkalicoccus chagannorensis]
MTKRNGWIQDVVVRGSEEGPLAGMSFGLKDVFDVQGWTNTAGNPDWFRTHQPAVSTAPVVEALLDGGALLAGLTVTDELMYSLQGENAHYGTPVNPAAPDRIPGGSSSGSASVTAAGLVDIGIGTDTGGSIRIPSVYCGLFGLRPTHGAVPVEGLIPLAPSFDTVGVMTRGMPELMKTAGVLFDGPADAPLTQVLLPEEAWELAAPATAETLRPLVPEDAVGRTLTENGLAAWAETFRIIQAYEIWQEHGPWITETKPSFGPGVKERFKMASTITTDAYEQAVQERKEITRWLDKLLGTDGMLLMPTAAGPAPALSLPPDEVDTIRKANLQLCCIAGLAGLPQVTIPVEGPDGWIGLSAVGPRHRDKDLLQRAASFMEADKPKPARD